MSRTKPSAERLLAEVDELRSRISELKAERAELVQAPIGKGTALARIDAYLDYLAGEARINVGPFVSREASQARELIHPAHVVTKEGGVGSVEFEPVLRFAAWHSRDSIRAALVADVEAYYTTRGDGLDDEPLAQRLVALDTELLELETDEERAITALAAAGRAVLRRADADPRALVAACS